MKNKASSFVLPAVILCAAFLSAGCVSTASSFTYDNDGTFGQALIVPVKDFQSLGMVFTEHKMVVTGSRADGDVITYNALLREASRLGADAIINVAIDNITKTVASASMISSAVTTEHVWYGSALAIKYTDVLITNDVVVNNPPSLVAAIIAGEGSQAASGNPPAETQKRGLFNRR